MHICIPYFSLSFDLSVDVGTEMRNYAALGYYEYKNSKVRGRVEFQQVLSFCICSLPIAMSACCSSSVNAVSGTSSDTGSTATVERLEAWFPASHLLPGVCRAKLRAGNTHTHTHARELLSQHYIMKKAITWTT